MSVRSYILINLVNGQKLRYVRDVSNGVNELYYTYGDSIGDTYLGQGDSTQIKYAFDALDSSIVGGDSYLKFPESAGDTYVIVRDNYDIPKGDRGDSEYWNPKVRTKIRTSSIVNISIIEERLDAWYSDNA
jgi:hypothetical protein